MDVGFEERKVREGKTAAFSSQKIAATWSKSEVLRAATSPDIL